jgi:hypothetical protein
LGAQLAHLLLSSFIAVSPEEVTIDSAKEELFGLLLESSSDDQYDSQLAV